MPRIVLVGSPLLSGLSAAQNTATSIIERRDELKRQDLQEREMQRREREYDLRAEEAAQRAQLAADQRKVNRMKLESLGPLGDMGGGQADFGVPGGQIGPPEAPSEVDPIQAVSDERSRVVLDNARTLMSTVQDPRLQQHILKMAEEELDKIGFETGYEVETKAIEDAMRDGKLTPEQYKTFTTDSQRARAKGAVAGAVHDDVIKAVSAYDYNRQLTKDWERTLKDANDYVDRIAELGDSNLPVWMLREFVNRYDFREDGSLSSRQGKLEPEAFMRDLKAKAIDVFNHDKSNPITPAKAEQLQEFTPSGEGRDGVPGPSREQVNQPLVAFSYSSNKDAFLRSLSLTLDNITEEQIADLARSFGINPKTIKPKDVREYLESDVGGVGGPQPTQPPGPTREQVEAGKAAARKRRFDKNEPKRKRDDALRRIGGM